MVDSYPNFFCTTEHRLLAYPQGSDLLSQSVHRSGVISRTEVQLGIHGFMQSFPVLQSKLSPIIGHNLLEYSCKQTILDIYNSASCGPE
jgi:hypothetical protein